MARQAGRSRSWVIREAVAEYAAARPSQRRPADALAPFIGVGGTGRSDLSEKTGERFAELARTKARARRTR
jgi:hypothetical protein